MRVQVDQAGQRDQPVRVDDVGAFDVAVAGYLAVLYQQVGPVPAEDRDSLEEVLHDLPPSSR
ncbi:hypothetical protein Prum_016640 [Phytohabitans rumicis]|uniref:Uncharacterized protein n=1 Tax=Phytohabitans rumicis TaxID=1076125 RepID=A0A6V8KSA4_9ACTN|nr:hypothetical protein Prum_016640 [Phytohabitans rumicis]